MSSASRNDDRDEAIQELIASSRSSTRSTILPAYLMLDELLKLGFGFYEAITDSILQDIDITPIEREKSQCVKYKCACPAPPGGQGKVTTHY